MTAINSNRAIRGPVTAVPVVAGKGVRLVADTENNRWVVEADETVLFDKTDAQGATLASPTITLSETYKNFSRLKVYWKTWNSLYSRVVSEFDLEIDNASFTCIGGFFSSSTIPSTFVINLTPNSAGTVLTFDKGKFAGLNTTSMSDATNSIVYKIVGVNRIASA